jgi:beta-glucosidase
MKSQPPPFLWGVATSSHQIEGGNEHNDWWAWEAEGHVEGGVRSGAATDHWNRFREDLQLAASLGLNSYRFSIEWSRLEPEEGVWNTVALDRYGEILSECERLGLLHVGTIVEKVMAYELNRERMYAPAVQMVIGWVRPFRWTSPPGFS